MHANPISEEKFSLEVITEDETTYVYLNGIIDEDAKYEEIAGLTGTIVINFKGISSINSCGVRNWVNFTKALEGRPVYYAECPPVIVRQLNMIPSFKGNAEIMSVFVPYVCDNCEKEKEVLISSDAFEGGNAEIQEVITCDSCGEEEMELDGDPQQYFAFAR